MISIKRPPARSAIFTSCALAALLVTSGIPDAHALPVTATGVNWSFTLDEDELSALAGSSIVFTGSIQNNTGFDLSIVGANIGFSLEDEDEEEEEEGEVRVARMTRPPLRTVTRRKENAIVATTLPKCR